MADAVKWGIISTADINRKVIPGAHASPKVELVGVASRDAGSAPRRTRRSGTSRARTARYEALLADPEIEAVYISLPNTMHCEWSIKSLEAGKHVLCEKPMSRHTDEVEAAFDAADSAGPSAQRGVHVPPQPADEARRSSSSPTARSASSASCARSSATRSTTSDNIRLRTDVEGGALMDVGCYNVSGSRLVAGEPEHVFGEAWYGPSGTDWVFSGTLRFPGDVIGALPLRHRAAGAGRARGDRQRRLALPRRPVALQRAGDRAATRRTASSGSRSSARTPTGSSSRT